MTKVNFVGLDVHSRSIAIAVCDSEGSVPANLATIPNDTRLLTKHLLKVGPAKSLRVCYEAGPTGFGLGRDLKAAGINCIVIAPSMVPEQAGDRVKTDKRDAVKLARFLRSGDLTEIYVPDTETEAMRDLERGRSDAKSAERVAKQQLLSFLLRRGRQYTEGKSTWTQAHFGWLRAQKFEEKAHEKLMVDLLKAVDDATTRVERLTKDIEELLETWSLRPLVMALQSMRGIQMLTAVTIAAELGNLKRFKSAPELMGFLGLVPSEHSSGERRNRGRITRTGNKHVRRALTESAWSYRYKPTMSRIIKKRNEGVPDSVKKIAWKAQQRLHDKYQRLSGRGKTLQKTIIAVAREMVGFIWAIGQEPKLLAS